MKENTQYNLKALLKPFPLIFILLFYINSSYSISTAIYPGEVKALFSSGQYLGVLEDGSLSLLDISDLNNAKANRVAEYNDRKVISAPINLGEEYLVEVEGGVVWLTRDLRERMFLNITGIIDAEYYGGNYYILTRNALYQVQIQSTPSDLGAKIINTLYFVDSQDAMLGIVSDSLAVLRQEQLILLDTANISLYKKTYSTPPHIISGDTYAGYFFFGDSYGNIIGANDKEIKIFSTLNSPVLNVKKFSSYVVFSTNDGVFLYSNTKGTKKLEFSAPIVKKSLQISSTKFALISQSSVYIIDSSLDSIQAEFNLGEKIKDAVVVDSSLVLITSSNKLVRFFLTDFGKGCYIINPQQNDVFGYVEKFITIFSNDESNLIIDGVPVSKLKEGKNNVPFDPKKYDFGKIRIECLGNQYPSIVEIYRDELGEKGSFIIEGIENRDVLDEGQPIKIKVKNQFGNDVSGYTIYLNNKVYLSNSPSSLEITLPVGDNTLVFSKEGYEDYSLTVSVVESPLSFYFKIILLGLVIYSIIYLTLIRTGILPKKIEELRKKIKELQ